MLAVCQHTLGACVCVVLYVLCMLSMDVCWVSWSSREHVEQAFVPQERLVRRC